MYSLTQLSLKGYKTTNYADYVGKKVKNGIMGDKTVCCGWMDIHEDSDNLGDSPKDSNFDIRPLFWSKEAIFIIKPRTKWRKLSKKEFLGKKKVPGVKYIENGFSFDAKKYHALVPKKIADKLAANPEFEESLEYKSFESRCSDKFSPKMVWNFEV